MGGPGRGNVRRMQATVPVASSNRSRELSLMLQAWVKVGTPLKLAKAGAVVTLAQYLGRCVHHRLVAPHLVGPVPVDFVNESTVQDITLPLHISSRKDHSGQ